MFPFYNPWKQKKTKGFLVSSGGIKCPKSTSTIDLLDQIVDIVEQKQIVARKSFFFFFWNLMEKPCNIGHKEKKISSHQSLVSVLISFFYYQVLQMKYHWTIAILLWRKLW